MKSEFNEKGILDGKYSLKIGNKNAEPEEFLSIFQNTHYYNDIRKFVRRVDNDTGIPYLKIKEYEKAKKIIPSKILNYFEEGTISYFNNKVYLRGKNYYLNYRQKKEDNKKPYSFFALQLLQNNIETILELRTIINTEINKSQTLEERMIIGSLLDLYKNHTMILFTGLY